MSTGDRFIIGGCQLGQASITCNCTGRCKSWPFTCTGTTSTPFIHTGAPLITSPEPASDFVLMLNAIKEGRELFKSQEDTINHIQKNLQQIEYVLGDVHKEGRPIRIRQTEKPQKPYDNIFDYKWTDQKGQDDIRHLKKELYKLYCWILDFVPDNKHRSKGIDLIEAAAMQLNKAISRRKDDGTQERRHDGESKG